MKIIDRKHFRITVEERDGGDYITTYWDKRSCSENDRQVEEFETFGGAVESALDLLDDATKRLPRANTEFLSRESHLEFLLGLEESDQ